MPYYDTNETDRAVGLFWRWSERPVDSGNSPIGTRRSVSTT